MAMAKLLIVLSTLSCAVLCFDYLYKLEIDDSEYDPELVMIDIGSSLPELGKPKFKVTQTGYNKYKVYIGYGNNRFIKFHYSDDPSMEFNIMNHKGSFRIKDSIFRPANPYGDDIIEIEGNIYESSPCVWCFLDGKVKMRLQGVTRRGIHDPMIMDISLSNSATIKDYIYLPTAVIREIDNMDVSLKVVIVPDNPIESRADLKFNLKARSMRSHRSYSRDYAPGHYNLTASLKPTQLDNIRKRQPKLSAKLEIAENKQFDATDILEPNFSREEVFRANQDNFRRSFNLDGMINLTNRGKRLAVLRLTDAETDRMVGRVQARFADQDNLRAELFYDGGLLGAINWHTTPTSSEVTMETEGGCPYREYGPYYESSTDSYKSAENFPKQYVDSYFNDTDYGNDYYYNNTDYSESGNYTSEKIKRNSTAEENYPHLDEVLGWHVESEDEIDSCNVVKLWKTTFNDQEITTRLYKDFVLDLSQGDKNYLKQWPEESALLVENIRMDNDGYGYNLTWFEGSRGYRGPETGVSVSGKVNNTGGNISIQLSCLVKQDLVQLFDFEPRLITFDMNMDKNDREKYKAKLKMNSERIFDGLFYDFFGISYYANQALTTFVPRYLKPYFEGSKGKEWNSYINTIGQLI